MNKRFGFTLAEVLITLVIIGIIASMTVPTLMNNTNSQEYRTGLKKAISVLNQAITMQYALDGTQISDFTTAANVRNSVFMRRLSVINSADAVVKFGDQAVTSSTVFYTADGMKFGINNAKSCDAQGETPCYDIIIDVNGDKKPNQFTTDAKKPLDMYKATVFSQRVVPFGPETQGVMFDVQ